MIEEKVTTLFRSDEKLAVYILKTLRFGVMYCICGKLLTQGYICGSINEVLVSVFSEHV
jgi:hypothetical protein